MYVAKLYNMRKITCEFRFIFTYKSVFYLLFHFLKSVSLPCLSDILKSVSYTHLVGARNLQECLLIQLANLAHPYAKLAILLVNEYLSELAQHKLTILAKKLDVAITDIQEALKLIQSLHPKPGSMYAATAVYLNPDVYVA